MFELAQLFDGLSRIWRRDPMAVPAIAIADPMNRGLLLACADDALTVQDVDGGVVFQTTLALPMVQVVGALTAAGFTASLVDPALGPVAGLALVDDEQLPLDGSGVTLGAATNPTWLVLLPIARRLANKAAQIGPAIAQLNLLEAVADFADYWATFLGHTRRVGETDAAFTARTLHQTIRPRANNVALKTLLTEDTGIPVTEVVDQEPTVFRPSTGPLRGRYLAGLRHNAAVCEVVADGFPAPDLVARARANVAAGVAVYVRGVLGLTDEGPGYVLDGTPLAVGDPPPMQIGVGAIGIARIGA